MLDAGCSLLSVVYKLVRASDGFYTLGNVNDLVFDSNSG